MGLFEYGTCHFKPMRRRKFRIQTVPSLVENRNLSLSNLRRLFKDVCVDVGKKTAVPVFEFVLQTKVKRKIRKLEREAKTEIHSSSSPFETLYSSHHFMAIIVS